ncbi:MFS transporter [Pseudomonas sp. CC120222-01a]|uniref:MFS transporter n=1 Tax=Pseudomonas sp. CC120222-01a TaxID=1378075 RepID=UPI000D81E5F1|nr:MFS transporter [Pseudomonas sp. CC120222-01a]PVZ41214.1 putative MFS transporter [Pseudomonas sp. CC120222-01a]
MKKSSISIEDVPLSGFHQKLTVAAWGGSFVDGYVLSIVGVVMLQMSLAAGLDSFWEGMIAAAALIGIFFGGLLGGWLTNQLGRKRILFVGPLIFMFASLAHLWVESAPMLFAMRLLIGVAVGIEYPVATAMLVEFMPRRSRGPRLAALALNWFIGAACAYAVGELILRSGVGDAWRIALASGAFFGALLFMVRVGLPESPRWLIAKGRAKAAELVIKRVYGPQFSLANLPEASAEQRLPLSALLRSGYGKRLFFVVMFWTCSIVPVFAVYAFAPKVLAALKLDSNMGSLGSVVITVFFVLGCLVCTWLINHIGRRNMLIYSFLLSTLALSGLAFNPAGHGMLVVVFFSLYALFMGGAQVLALVYPNEIFPTEMRALAVGVGTAFSRIGAAVGTYLVPISLESLGVEQTLYIAILITLVGLVISWMMAPETSSLNLQQAAALN